MKIEDKIDKFLLEGYRGSRPNSIPKHGEKYPIMYINGISSWIRNKYDLINYLKSINCSNIKYIVKKSYYMWNDRPLDKLELIRIDKNEYDVDYY